MAMTSGQITDFLKRTQIAVITTIDKAARPRSAPVWYQWENGAAYMFTGRNTLKWRNIKERPYASLCVDWREPPYESVIMDGCIEEVDRSLYPFALAIASRYYGKKEGRQFAEEYRDNPKDVAVFRLVPRHIASFGIDD